MTEKVNDFNVGRPDITGSTTINHEARVQMGLTCSEYVFMDQLSRMVKKKQEVTVMDFYRTTGFTEDQQTKLLRSCVRKNFIAPKNLPIPELTSKWESGFADVAVEFDKLFWRKNGKVIWTGSKRKAEGLYAKLRKNCSKEFLIKQRDAYLEVLTLENMRGFPRQIMMAERWLRESNGYYEADWEFEASKIRASIESAEAEKKRENLTQEDRKNQYEQDSNV